MKIKFKMTGEEYLRAFKLKAKVCKKNYSSVLVFVVLALALLDVSLFTFGDYYYSFIATILSAVAVITYSFKTKKSMSVVCERAVVIKDEQSLFFDDNGLTLIGKFDKIKISLKSIFYAKLYNDLLVIIPSYKRGIIAINRERYKGEELDELIALLQKNNLLRGSKNEG